MNGAYGVGPLAFQRLFDRLLDAVPWVGAALSVIVLLWIAHCWRNA